MKNNVKTATKTAAKATPKLKIAILSFGSLIQKNNKLESKDKLVDGKWNTGGVALPVEFCRISNSGKLVLAISPKVGVENNSLYAQAKDSDLNIAIRKFLKLEGIDENRICVLDLKNKVASERCNSKNMVNISKNVAAWANKKGFDCVLFNGLGPKFKNEIDIPYSVQAGLTYIGGLKGKTLKEQIAYFQNVPKTIKTPFLEVWKQGMKKAAK
jgi:hypothetical protein